MHRLTTLIKCVKIHWLKKVHWLKKCIKMKITYLVWLTLPLIGCHTHITHNHEASPPIYSVLETTPSDVVGDDYKLPSHIRTLPISPFTWYPEGSTLVLPIGLDGVVGRFVWQNNCLLFKPDDFDGFVTPIFWVNSIKDYQIRYSRQKCW